MSFFGTRISRPQPVPSAVQQGQRVPYNGGNIQVVSATLPAGGDYVRTVTQHLNEIAGFPLGAQFLQAIQATGKNVIIVYGGVNNNQAAGSPLGFCMLRRHHEAGDKGQFGTELNRMITASGKSKKVLASELFNKAINTWGAATIPSPFRSVTVTPNLPSPNQPRPLGARPLPPIPGSRPAPTKPLPMSPGDAVVAKLDAWIAGTATLPTYDELDAILLVLEAHIQHGPGVGTRINYDPHKTTTATGSRPPHVALFHELVHAYYNATGTQLGREDSVQESNGGRLFELMSVGLPPFNTRPYSENQFRAVLNVTPRAVYP
jgi:hypothetical protein